MFSYLVGTSLLTVILFWHKILNKDNKLKTWYKLTAAVTVNGLTAESVSHFGASWSGLLFFLVVFGLLELLPDSLICPPPPILQRLHQLLQPRGQTPAALGTLGRGRTQHSERLNHCRHHLPGKGFTRLKVSFKAVSWFI